MKPLDVSHLPPSPPDDVLAAMLFLRSRVPDSLAPLIPVIQLHGILSSDSSKIDVRVDQLTRSKNGLRRLKLPNGSSAALGDEALMFDQDYLDFIDGIQVKDAREGAILDAFKEVLQAHRSLSMSRDELIELIDKEPSSPSNSSPTSVHGQVDAVTQLMRFGLVAIPKTSKGQQLSLAIPKSGGYLAALLNGRKELLKLLRTKSGVMKDVIASKFNKIVFANRSPILVTSSTTPAPLKKRSKAVVIEKRDALDLEAHLAELLGAGWIHIQPTPMGDMIRLTSKGIAHSKSRT